MKIGQAAAGAGVNVQTVRYYERRGLLPIAQRSRSGYRKYGPEVIPRLRFIRRAQELGFSLEEIIALLDLRVDDGDVCTTVGAKTKEKIAGVEEKIKKLESIRTVLIELARACDEREPTGDCPILRALDEDG